MGGHAVPTHLFILIGFTLASPQTRNTKIALRPFDDRGSGMMDEGFQISDGEGGE